MSAALTPYDATRQAGEALTKAGNAIGGPVRIESRAASMPRAFGGAVIATTVTPTGPGADLAAAERVLASLPGVLAHGISGRTLTLYRRREP